MTKCFFSIKGKIACSTLVCSIWLGQIIRQWILSADICCSANLGWSAFSILRTINFSVGDAMAQGQEGGQKILILMLQMSVCLPQSSRRSAYLKRYAPSHRTNTHFSVVFTANHISYWSIFNTNSYMKGCFQHSSLNMNSFPWKDFMLVLCLNSTLLERYCLIEVSHHTKIKHFF